MVPATSDDYRGAGMLMQLMVQSGTLSRAKHLPKTGMLHCMQNATANASVSCGKRFAATHPPRRTALQSRARTRHRPQPQER